MPVHDTNWLKNRPGPLKDVQPHKNPFADGRGSSKVSRAAAQGVKAQLKMPGSKLSVHAQQLPQYIERRSGGTTGKRKASDWDAQRPGVLYNDHPEFLLKHEYKRGMIINAPVHEAMSGKGKSRTPSHFESISAWGPVFTKPRYLIVVALHEMGYTCVPLYSHNQEGLRGKEHYRNEFVSVHDGRLDTHFIAQSDLRPLVTEMLKGPIIDPTSVAWLTHPVSRKYDLNLSVCGHLTKDSLDQLIRYMDITKKKGLGLT